MAVWLANCDRLPVTTSSRLSTALEVPNQVCSGGFGRECPSVAERPLAIMAQGKGRGEGKLVVGGSGVPFIWRPRSQQNGQRTKGYR